MCHLVVMRMLLLLLMMVLMIMMIFMIMYTLSLIAPKVSCDIMQSNLLCPSYLTKSLQHHLILIPKLV